MRFVRYAAVASGNSFIDGKNGFAQVLVVCCGAGSTFDLKLKKIHFCGGVGRNMIGVHLK